MSIVLKNVLNNIVVRVNFWKWELSELAIDFDHQAFALMEMSLLRSK